jgi:hypothetical protein
MIHVNIMTATEKLIPIYKIFQFRGVLSKACWQIWCFSISYLSAYILPIKSHSDKGDPSANSAVTPPLISQYTVEFDRVT